MKNERFIVAFAFNLTFGNFTLPFSRLRHINVLKSRAAPAAKLLSSFGTLRQKFAPKSVR